MLLGEKLRALGARLGFQMTASPRRGKLKSMKRHRPKLTPARIRALLRQAAPGANELLRYLERLSRLTPRQASLRLD